jgi:hypothetical protein
MRRALLQVMAPMALLFLDVSQSRAQHKPKYSADEDAVLKVDEAFRRAKQENDTATLRRIVANNYVGTNQFGETRNKTDLLELFATISLKSVTSKPSQVRITGEVAVVSGSQSEVNGGGFNSMVFMRVYVRNREAGEWQLLANMQSMAPN